MGKKKKKIPRNKRIEIINFTKKTVKVINLDDEVVIFDEKTGTYQVIPISGSTYIENDTRKKT